MRTNCKETLVVLGLAPLTALDLPKQHLRTSCQTAENRPGEEDAVRPAPADLSPLVSGRSGRRQTTDRIGVIIEHPVQGLPEERVIVDEQHRDGTEHTGTALLDVTCIYQQRDYQESSLN